MAKLSFENAMEQLEKIVQQLESGDLPLETAIKKFEEGMKLSRFCNAKLNESEKKIELLTEGVDGSIASKPFELAEENGKEDSELEF